jgi:hypothetical protein
MYLVRQHIQFYYPGKKKQKRRKIYEFLKIAPSRRSTSDASGAGLEVLRRVPLRQID